MEVPIKLAIMEVTITHPSSVWTSTTPFQNGKKNPVQYDVESNAQIDVKINDVKSNGLSDVKSNGRKVVKCNAPKTIERNAQSDVKRNAESLSVESPFKTAGFYMHENDVIYFSKLLSIETFVCILCKCREKRNSTYAQLIYFHMCFHGLDCHKPLRGMIMLTFVECGRTKDAERVFYRHMEGNSSFQCSLLEVCLTLGEYDLAFELVPEMEHDYVHMDKNVIQSLLKYCAKRRCIRQGRSIHAHIVSEGMEEDFLIGSSIVEMYANCGALSEARDVFDEIPIRDVVTLTILSSAYADHGFDRDASYFLEQIRMEDVVPNVGMLLCSLKACKKTKSVGKGRELHIQISKWGLESNTFIGSALLDMYAKCGLLAEAHHVFDGILSRDVISWTALIAGYADNGHITSALDCLEKMKTEGVFPNSVTFLCILRGCTNIATIARGQEVHIEAVKEEFEKDPVIGSALIDMYVKWGSLAEAQAVFEELPVRDVVLWTTLIAGYAEQGFDEEVLKCLEKVQAEGVSMDSIMFVHSLKACGSVGAIGRGQKIHAEVVKEGFELNSFVGSTLMDMYAKNGLLLEALEIFHELPERDVVSWTTLITGYVEYELPDKVRESLEEMQQEGILPSDVTLACSLQAYGNFGFIDEGCKVHIDIVKRGFERDPFVANALLDLYAKCALISEVWKVFDDMAVKDVVSWNTLITCLAEQELNNEALELLEEMQIEGIYPNVITVLCCLKACGSLGAIEIGQETHMVITKLGLEKYPFVCNTLVDMYAKCGHRAEVNELFNKTPSRDVVSWNILLSEFVECKHYEKGLYCLQEMEEDKVTPNVVTFVYGLKCCGSIPSLDEGQILYTKIISHGCEVDDLLGGALIEMYAKCGTLMEAKNVFDRLLYRDTAWNSLISGYTDNGFVNEALSCYDLMQTEGTSPDVTTFISVVKACGLTGSINRGREVHLLAVKEGFEANPYVFKVLIDMYAKCASLIDAHYLFLRLDSRDLIVWSAIIMGYARQGETRVVFQLFEQMKVDGVDPDGVILLSILSACNHGGFVDIGQRIFGVMIEEYCISLDIEHHNCMIDLLGRAGQLGKAMSWLTVMPFQPNCVTWSSILGACQKWSNRELGQRVFELASKSISQDSDAFYLMYNIYTDDTEYDKS